MLYIDLIWAVKRARAHPTLGLIPDRNITGQVEGKRVRALPHSWLWKLRLLAICTHWSHATTRRRADIAFL